MLSIEENPMLATNVKLWKFLSVILSRNWNVVLFVGPVCVMNAMQFVYLFRMWGNLAPFILNTFFTAAIFDALLRTCLVIRNRDKFEAFMGELAEMYREIEESHDSFAKGILEEYTKTARKISIFNLTASFCDIIGALLYPLFSKDRVHPFGVALPGVDMTASPIYEIAYLLQIPTPAVLTAMYMPFVSLFASFAMFGKVALLILQQKLKKIGTNVEESEREKYTKLCTCIKEYKRISIYVKNFNALVTYIVFAEFILFGAIICSLLFCLNLIKSFTQTISVVMYIFTMMYVLFTYYWQANELSIESIKVSDAAYSISWYQCRLRFRQTLMIFISQTQRPLQIMVGNVYPMSLDTFQSLLNASYSYFTILRGVYKKNE